MKRSQLRSIREAVGHRAGHAAGLHWSLAGGYAFYRSATIGTGRAQQDAKLAATLARAKEALIARAVTDANRPGSLPCPDLITNNAGLSNFPGDGKADMFTLTQCPSYVGWLPWVTLDLPELTDDTGTRLWYALSPELRDDDSAQPINSDRALALRLDGAADIAAIIIRPARRHRQPVPASPTTRPTISTARTATATIASTFPACKVRPSTTWSSPSRRQELMAAVDKRVASEVKACLEQHAASAVNTEHTYPWPAPVLEQHFPRNCRQPLRADSGDPARRRSGKPVQKTTSALDQREIRPRQRVDRNRPDGCTRRRQ